MKSKFFVTLLACFIFSFALASGQSLSLDHVDGLTSMGNLDTNTPIVFYLRMASGPENYDGITNGFTISSPDASWGATVADTVFPMKTLFDGIFAINTFSVDGVGTDTVGFGGSKFFGIGMGPNFDDVTYSITIGPIADTEIGKTITLDSSFYTPTGAWKWAGPEAFPTWDGPHTFTIGDVATNTPPVLAAIGPQAVNEGQELVINISATDDDSDPITLTASPLPAGAGFVDNEDGTGTFTWTPGFDQAGTYDVTFTATDGTDTDDELVTITVTDANQPPVLVAIGPQGGDENTNINFVISATDADGTTPAFTSSALPGTATFVDNGDGTATFDWTTTFDDAGVYNVTFFASDGSASDSEIVAITVNNINREPVLADIGPQATDEGVNLGFIVSASDPDGDALSLTSTPLPTGALYTDNGDGTATFDWTPDFSQAGLYDVTFYVTDGDVIDSELVSITVTDVNQAPVLADIGPQFVTAGENINFVVSAFDPDGNAPVVNASPLPGTATFDNSADSIGIFDWTTTPADSGVYEVLFTATDGALVDSELVVITVGEAPVLLTATPDTLFFAFFTGEMASDTGIINVTAANGDAIVDAVEFSDWMDVNAYVSSAAPVEIKVAVYPNVLPAGVYTDTVRITSADAVNTQTVYIVMTLTDMPNNVPVVVSPTDTVFFTDECTPITIDFVTTDADEDALFLGVFNMVENMVFTDNGDGTGALDFTPSFSQAGTYPLDFYVTDGADTTFLPLAIIVDECEPGTEGDTVSVATVPAVPGAQVVVPIDFANLCNLEGFDISVGWNSENITLDSATFGDTRLEIPYNFEINNADDFFRIYEAFIEVNVQTPGSGNLVNLHFALDVGIPAGFYPLDFYMEPSYDRNCGSGIETIRPFFIPGGIVVDTSGNYVCGYVVDPDGNPIPGATVELWDYFPGNETPQDGSVQMTQTASGNGVFAFSDFTTIPFDLYAYHDGYYPGVVQDINFAQSGIMIVLTPYEPVTPTNEWVNFYCGSNTFFGKPLPVGSVVEAFDPDGVKCGEFIVVTEGEYGFMPVYRDDAFAEGDQGADPGDILTFKVNGDPVFLSDTPVWTEHGASFEICIDVLGITSKRCILTEGWNLVSWSLEPSSDDIVTFFSSIEDYVEVVMGYEQGALTYDPTLPQFSDLWTIDILSAYWVKVSQTVELRVVGTPVPYTTPIRVTTGWNLVSYLRDSPMATDSALTSIYDNLIVALGYDGGMGSTHIPGQGEFNDLDEMSSCLGYWVKVTQDDMLIYPDESAGSTAAGKDMIAQVSSSAGLINGTTSWMNIYSHKLTLNGESVESGAEINAFNIDGVKVGSYIMKQNGQFGFMPIYGDDARTAEVDGMKSGDQFYLTVDGVETKERFTWTSSGDKQEILSLSSTSTVDVLPSTFGLNQNYPNPFNPTTTISFEMPAAGQAKIEIFNLLGQLIDTPLDAQVEAGYNSVVWDGRNSSGNTVASGIYFYRLSADNYTETKKMTLLK